MPAWRHDSQVLDRSSCKHKHWTDATEDIILIGHSPTFFSFCLAAILWDSLLQRMLHALMKSCVFKLTREKRKDYITRAWVTRICCYPNMAMWKWDIVLFPSSFFSFATENKFPAAFVFNQLRLPREETTVKKTFSSSLKLHHRISFLLFLYLFCLNKLGFSTSTKMQVVLSVFTILSLYLSQTHTHTCSLPCEVVIRNQFPENYTKSSSKWYLANHFLRKYGLVWYFHPKIGWNWFDPVESEISFSPNCLRFCAD